MRRTVPTVLAAAVLALAVAAPLAAQQNGPLIHARVTAAARGATRIRAARTLPPAARASVASAHPLTPDQIKQLTGAIVLPGPVTLTLNNRVSNLAQVTFEQPEEVPSYDSYVWFEKTTGTFDHRGPEVTVQAQAGKKYLLDFVINWFQPVSMKVTLPDGEQTATFNAPGTHHVTVVLDAAAAGAYPVLLQSTDREWLFISCTVTPLQ
jgi:hypothetical protein